MLIPATSTDFVHVPVTVPVGVDVTGTPPQLAFLPASNRGNPTVGDWETGEWADGTTARILVGPDGGVLTLTPGDYRVFISFDPPGPESIVRLSGYLSIS